MRPLILLIPFVMAAINIPFIAAAPAGAVFSWAALAGCVVIGVWNWR